MTDEVSNAGPVVGQPAGDPPAQSAPAPGDAVGQTPATSAPEAPAPQEVAEAAQDVTQEVQNVEAAVSKPSVETVAQAAAPVTSALEALALSKATNPGLSFSEHLKGLADKGLAAVLNPADESVILGALVSIIKEVVA